MLKKKSLLFFAFSLFAITASAQFGVSYHESSMPFLGFNYELDDQFFGELRVGTNHYFEDITFELTANYIFVKNSNFDLYGGIGGRTSHFSGLVIPAGLNLYPFEDKHFGFHLEAAGMFGEGSILRASWGIRYRFGSTGASQQEKED
ncbi:MAG: hypothetical protein KGY60_01495 [Bacteroidales bacterium]|nr:hypothetical protein [Bacteroidales bacterium]